MKKSILIALAFYACSFVAFGQIKTPAPSPKATVTQAVGLIDVSLEYSRPGVKDRTIFGDLVPYDKMWRTGANASSKIEFSEDVTVSGQALEKGKYALYTIPGKEMWTFIFHKNLDHWGTGGDKYDITEDALRVTAKPEMLPFSVETFTLEVSNLKDDGGDLMLFWDNVMVMVPIKVATGEAVQASIDKVMAGPSWYDKYQAARYYMENGKDINQAMTWFSESVADKGGEKFWVLRQMSLCQAKLGKYKDAIATANKSKMLAEKAGNDQYVKFNMKSIAEWANK